MKITLAVVGRNGDRAIEDLIQRYVKRLGHYCRFEVRMIDDPKATRTTDTARRKELEGLKVLETLSPPDHVILLDERGEQPSSRGFAQMLERHLNRATPSLVFVVGGPYGFSPALYDRANGMLSLSRMTLTHEMVRLFFVEQVYRAFTILRGENYHHD